MEPALSGLDYDGQLLAVGAGAEQTPDRHGGERSASAARSRSWASGTCADSEDTLRFAVQTGVRAMIETFPLERAAEAFERQMSGNARFRVVLVP